MVGPIVSPQYMGYRQTANDRRRRW